MTQENLTLGGHLGLLRTYIVRIIIVTVVYGSIAFGCRGWLFNIVLAPSQSKFFVCHMTHAEPFDIRLVNIRLTGQFLRHVLIAIVITVAIIMSTGNIYFGNRVTSYPDALPNEHINRASH